LKLLIMKKIMKKIENPEAFHKAMTQTKF